MKTKIRYTEERLGELRVVKDFLPLPEDLVFKKERVKITMSLSKASVDFFKAEAKRHRTSYQSMIRRLLDLYVSKYSESSTRRSNARAARRAA